MTEEQFVGRAQNAILAFFELRLAFPKIYLDAEWAGIRVDVLAIERDGLGDVHLARLYKRQYFSDSGLLNIVSEAQDAVAFIDEYASAPAQFKYIAAVDDGSHDSRFPYSGAVMEKALSADGFGRIGFLRVDVIPDREARAELISKPERFRARVNQLADDYVGHHTADWELRA